MAPNLAKASANSVYRQQPPTTSQGVMTIRKRNEELEKKLRQSLEREEEMRKELERTWKRLAAAEEAEEMLYSQLGELEAEAVQQAQAYQSRMVSLLEQLAQTRMLLSGSAPESP